MLRRLEREGLAPLPQADKETLISRVSLTLTGLPPTLEEIDAFVADSAPDAYERLVDRLLASPAYAEHMADYWLDLARFSETDGFLDDHHDRLLWPWRDWVIDSFARNRPFDEFGTWQLAGDLLPKRDARARRSRRRYLRVGKRTTENGAIDAEYKAEYMVERTDNALGVAFLGLTVGCARCHDHKYDPIKQTDYYSLGAFFNSNDEPGAYAPGFSGIQGGPTLPWPDDATAAALRDATADVARKADCVRRARNAAAEPARAAGRAAGGEPPDAAARIRAALADSLAAHYEFESRAPRAARRLAAATRTAHSAARRSRCSGAMRYGGARRRPPTERRATPAARGTRARGARAAQLQRGVADAVAVRRRAAVAPAVDPRRRCSAPGVRGQALFFDETNRGFPG